MNRVWRGGRVPIVIGEAQDICPYSEVTRGNIEVTIKPA
jgi:organic hydroperoxide reductase OsmC/OhrA